MSYNPSQPRDKNGEWAVVAGAARKAAGVLQSGVMFAKDKNSRDALAEEMIPIVRKAAGTGSYSSATEMYAASNDYLCDVYIKRNPEGKIIAAASFSFDNGWNIDGKEVSMLHIGHIGSLQAGEGLRIISALEKIGKERGAVGLTLESRLAAREYWAKTGFQLVGNSANRYMRKF
jgi:hypothetical protein